MVRQVLAVREDPAFVAMFLQMYAMEMHNISSGAHGEIPLRCSRTGGAAACGK